MKVSAPINAMPVPSIQPGNYSTKMSPNARAKHGRSYTNMRNFLLITGSFCAAAVGLIIWGPQRRKPVEELALRLEMAWADHHTVV